MAVVRWLLTDPVTSATYEFEMNPTDGGSPSYAKSIDYISTAAPDGQVVMFQGRDKVEPVTIQGKLRTQAAYEALRTWWQKSYPVNLIDDLGREYQIFITDFRPTRVRAATAPWKHDYSLSYLVLEEL